MQGRVFKMKTRQWYKSFQSCINFFQLYVSRVYIFNELSTYLVELSERRSSMHRHWKCFLILLIWWCCSWSLQFTGVCSLFHTLSESLIYCPFSLPGHFHMNAHVSPAWHKLSYWAPCRYMYLHMHTCTLYPTTAAGMWLNAGRLCTNKTLKIYIVEPQDFNLRLHTF